jgi:hypothetical protein
MNNKKFEKDGYLIFKTDLINNQNFNNLTKEIYLNLNHQLNHTDIKILRGYQMGNINVNPGKFGHKLLELLYEIKFNKIIETVINKKIEDMVVTFGGNLSLAGKGEQHFHTDGSYSKEMYLVSIATENIDKNNGPTKVCVGSHSINQPYWKFFLSRKNKQYITLNKGDIVIRKHYLWHKGTKNKSKKNRLLLSILLFPKNHVVRKINENEDISFSSNFFSEDYKGLIQEFIYTKLRLVHFILRFLKSFL